MFQKARSALLQRFLHVLGQTHADWESLERREKLERVRATPIVRIAGWPAHRFHMSRSSFHFDEGEITGNASTTALCNSLRPAGHVPVLFQPQPKMRYSWRHHGIRAGCRDGRLYRERY